MRDDTEATSQPDIKVTASDWLLLLTPLTVSEVENLIERSANKQCHLDPASTFQFFILYVTIALVFS